MKRSAPTTAHQDAPLMTDSKRRKFTWAALRASEAARWTSRAEGAGGGEVLGGCKEGCCRDLRRGRRSFA